MTRLNPSVFHRSLQKTVRARITPLLRSVACAAAIATIACGGGGSTDSGTGPVVVVPQDSANVLSLAVTSSATIAQGGSADIAATAARVLIANAVTLTVTGAPAGVTATITQPQGTGLVVTGLITLATTSAAAPGTYTLTVRANATGATAVTATVTLTITAAGSYTVLLGTTALALEPGASNITNISINRTNFSAPITFSAENLPTGVTASFTPNPVTFATTTLTLTAAANAPLTTVNIVVRTSSVGFADKTATLPVSVAALGGFSLSSTPATVSMPQGATTTTTLNLARSGGFTTFVLTSIEGAPTGLTLSIPSSTIVAGSSVLTITSAANLAVGTYPVVIRAVSPGIPDATVTIPVTITAATAGGTGNVVLDFSACVGFDVPAWVAWQDGATGTWTRLTSTTKIYSFTVTQAVGAFAYVTQGATTNTAAVNVQNMSRAELSAAPFVYCALNISLKIANGTVTGVTGNDGVNIYLGGGLAYATAAIPSFALSGIVGGAHDLIAWRHDPIAEITGASANDRGFVRRDVNVAAGGSVGNLDMNGSESFTPASATFTVNGLAGEEISQTFRYNTESACIASTLYGSSRMVTANTFLATGFPTALQRATDFHQLLFTATTRQSGISYPLAQRTVLESYKTLTSRTITLSRALPVPTVTTLSGTVKRVQAVVTIPAEYNSSVSLSYFAVNKNVTILATPAWIGLSTATLAMPNFTGVAGWLDVYAPAASATVQWTLSANGTNITGTTACVDNGRIYSAFRQGTI